jgi:transcriptional regulator with XRE-family HTH domain
MNGAAVLTRARQRAGLTQAELARRAGTSQPVISAYEHGRRDPSIETLRRLVRAAGAELELGIGVRHEQDLPAPVDDDDRAARLVDVLLLADAIPSREHATRPTLAFPRLRSA